MRKPSIKTAGVAGANILAIAVGGMLAGATVGCSSMGSSAEASEGARHACKGMNACKGQGGCGSSANGCGGKNDCKGQGGCATAAKHACKGMNECKGQGGCSTGNNGCGGKNDCKGRKGGCKVG